METRKPRKEWSKTCKSCKNKLECVLDKIAVCENYVFAGNRYFGSKAVKAKTEQSAVIDSVIQCKEGGCKYYDEKLKSRCSRGDDPENCLHYEFQPVELRRQESKSKNLSGIPNLKLERSKPDKVEKQHTHKEKPAFSCHVPIEPLMSFSEFLEAIKIQGFEIVIRPVKT